MRTAKLSLAELAANRPSIDRARIAATDDREIDRQITEDEDTAPDVTTLGAGHAMQPGTIDVKALRERLNMTQASFAATFGFSPWTVRQWEQRRREPTGPARVLLTVINREPEAVRRALSAE